MGVGHATTTNRSPKSAAPAGGRRCGEARAAGPRPCRSVNPAAIGPSVYDLASGPPCEWSLSPARRSHPCPPIPLHKRPPNRAGRVNRIAAVGRGSRLVAPQLPGPRQGPKRVKSRQRGADSAMRPPPARTTVSNACRRCWRQPGSEAGEIARN
jgi:hypothetical protein